MVMNKISVFGSTGFIGGKFCEMFSENTVRIPREQRESETNEILNFISTTHNYSIFEDVLKEINTNVIIMLQMLDNAKKKFGNNFVFNQISTWSVYGNVELPAKEDYPCNPTGFYSISKRTAEQMIISYCKTFDVKYRIFRLCNVIGESDKIVPKKKNALQYLINELKENHDINLYHNGDFLREYMYVDDVCSAIKLCIDKGNTNETYNIGGGTKQVFADLINYCKDRLNSTSKISKINPSGFHDIVQAKDMFLDNSKIKSLGFSPKFDIYSALDIIMDNEYLIHD
jgi:nucleoside-diphosphate-sugar epimerase